MTAYSPSYTSVAAVQAKTGLSNTEYDLTSDDNVRATIEDAELELELLTARKFTNANTATEFISGPAKDALGNYSTSIMLSNRPIQSITVLNVLDIDGTADETYDTLSAAEIAAGTYESEDYWVKTSRDSLTGSIVPNGFIRLKTDTFPKGTNNIKVTYTYGYSSVPIPVRNLATCLAGIRVWIAFLGGSYNRLDSYSIPQQTVSKGDFYQRGKQNIEQLTNEANGLLDRIGRIQRRAFFATGSDR